MNILTCKLRNNKGFTLLEVLLVVAIIAILASIVIIAINPGKQLADSRNAQRSADVSTILNSVYQYSVDHSGTLPTGITTATIEICATTGSPACDDMVDLGVITATEKYLTSIPKDPKCVVTCADGGTGYTISKTANNRITVSAPSAEQSKTISVTR